MVDVRHKGSWLKGSVLKKFDRVDPRDALGTI
jgi:hypothetical protein